MRTAISSLGDRAFDVVVIGAGINGAAAAQHLTAAGFSVLLVDKGDFASGSSGRSSRILHCGLRYLAPGSSMWDFLLHPDRLAAGLRMARLAMQARAEFVASTPERAFATKCHFPIYKDGPYATWQVGLALRVLAALGSRELPLGQRIIPPEDAKSLPLIRWLRDPEKLDSIATYAEYQFDWPERICIDAVLDAERMGALVRNYTEVTALMREGDAGWKVTLVDRLERADPAIVHGKVILNTAGIWIDRVNARATTAARRRITGTKGCHIMVRLPPECREYGIATLNRLREPFYCLPWRGLHYFGPTETLYEGDLDDIRVSEEEIDFLLGEANFLLSALSLKRSDVISTWAGVRPLTHDPALPKGSRSRVVHDLAEDGLPNVLALTAGPIMSHRSAGRDLTKAVLRRLAPTRPPQQPSYLSHPFPENQNSPPLLDDDASVRLSDLRHAAAHEYPASLVDVLIRRTGAGLTEDMASAAAGRAAATIADILGWDGPRMEQEVRSYHDYVSRTHGCCPAAPARADVAAAP